MVILCNNFIYQFLRSRHFKFIRFNWFIPMKYFKCNLCHTRHLSFSIMNDLTLRDNNESFVYWITRMLNNAHANLINYIMSMLGLKPTLSKILLSKEKHPAGRTIKIENYFRNCDEQVYSSLDWESGAETDEASEFLEDDQDDGTLRDGMKEKLKFSMKQIKAYHVLGCLVESGRQEYYDSENEVHEEKLLSLWNLLNPNEKLSARKSKQWEDIGFQGLDPATGMFEADSEGIYCKGNKNKDYKQNS